MSRDKISCCHLYHDLIFSVVYSVLVSLSGLFNARQRNIYFLKINHEVLLITNPNEWHATIHTLMKYEVHPSRKLSCASPVERTRSCARALSRRHHLAGASAITNHNSAHLQLLFISVGLLQENVLESAPMIPCSIVPTQSYNLRRPTP